MELSSGPGGWGGGNTQCVAENRAASALSKYLWEDSRKWRDREHWDTEGSEQDLGDLATFFTRDKQGLYPITSQIYKCKARRNGLLDKWWGYTQRNQKKGKPQYRS